MTFERSYLFRTITEYLSHLFNSFQIAVNIEIESPQPDHMMEEVEKKAQEKRSSPPPPTQPK